MKAESQRLREKVALGEFGGPKIVISAQASESNDSLGRVKEVLQQIIDCSSNDHWPSDEEWTARLPQWFTSTFEGRTIEAVLADENLWDYGSWLDAMRHRGWEWWNSSFDEAQHKWAATLVRAEDVYSIEPLVYLARQSGASAVEVTEE